MNKRCELCNNYFGSEARGVCRSAKAKEKLLELTGIMYMGNVFPVDASSICTYWESVDDMEQEE